MAEKLADSEIKTIFDNELMQALGYAGSDLSEQRGENMKRYLAEEYGNELQNRSQVVSSDAMDTVEWILPSLLRIFTSGDEAVRYDPRKPEDTEAAAQATEYVNWVWNSQNDGFLNTYVFLKDALIGKNGHIKIWWDEREDYKREEYEDLDDISFVQIVTDPDVEVVEHSEEPSEDPLAPPGTMTHDLVIKRRKESGRVIVAPIPPEEFLISRDARTIDDARFVAHRRKRTISDLIAEGYSEEKLSQIGSGDTGVNYEAESLARNTSVDEAQPDARDAVIDRAVMQVWVTEGYMRADRNGDGIAEMLKIVSAGSVILDIEDWEGPRPFASWTPIMQPHRFYGISIVDTVRDLQLIKTTILRQYLDGLYLANMPRYEVDEDRVSDPKEVTDGKPGGIIRKRGSEPVMTPVITQFTGDTALAGLAYIDQLRENRTGVSPRVQGLGSNTMHDTASGESMLMTKAMEKVELIARIFAETGLKDAFKLILSLLCRYQDKEAVIRLKGQWVPMNPRSWDTEFDVSVNVGLGNGTRETLTQHMMALLQMQIQAITMQGGLNGPLVTGENVYNALTRYVEAIGLRSVEPYFTNPKMMPPSPPPPNPEAMKAQAEMQKLQAQMEIEQQKAQQQALLKQQDSQLNAQLEREKAQRQAEIEAMQAQADIAVMHQKAQAQMEIERQKAEFEAQIKVLEMQLREKEMAHKASLEADKHAREAAMSIDQHRQNSQERAVGADAMAKAVQTMAAAVEKINQPKRVVRGPDGKVSGVE